MSAEQQSGPTGHEFPMGSLAPRRSDVNSADQAELRGCLAGDAKSIEQLYRRHTDAVTAMIARLVGPTPDLEDLVHATFVEVLSHLKNFRGEATLRTWIISIAVHVAHHHLRAKAVRRHVPLELVPGPQLVAPTDDVERKIDRRRLQAALHRLLDQLAPS